MTSPKSFNRVGQPVEKEDIIEPSEFFLQESKVSSIERMFDGGGEGGGRENGVDSWRCFGILLTWCRYKKKSKRRDSWATALLNPSGCCCWSCWNCWSCWQWRAPTELAADAGDAGNGGGPSLWDPWTISHGKMSSTWSLTVAVISFFFFFFF